MDSLNFNSVETLPNLSARAAFQVNSSAVFKEDVDIVPVIIDDTLMCRGETTTICHSIYCRNTLFARFKHASTLLLPYIIKKIR